MAITAKYYGLFLKSLANKEIDLDSDTIKAMLVTSAYTFDQDAHQYKSSITGEVASNGTTNYPAGGVALTGVTVTYSTSTNTLVLDAADPVIPAGSTTGTFTAAGVVFYDSTPSTDATRPLIAFVDFGGSVTVTGAQLTLPLDAAGLLQLSVA